MKRTAPFLVLAPALVISACAPNTNDSDQGTETAENIELSPVAEEIETIEAGLAVGETAPLTATFNTGDGETSLAALLEQGPAVFIFTRSVDWCPFCQTQLKGVNAVVSDLDERGYKLYGVSYDSIESQDRFSKNQMLDYAMLSDEKSAAIDAFDLRDPQYTEGKAVGVPYASVVVVSKDGKITAKAVSGDFKKRPTNEQLLALIDAI